ncbi:hypothetical protein E1178_08645 [Roseibium hamelinense]|nr:hypothetical protein [Roseibium hamelinense]MTI43677.1 hypothetical protein [Roseibium hamelinense]
MQKLQQVRTVLYSDGAYLRRTGRLQEKAANDALNTLQDIFGDRLCDDRGRLDKGKLRIAARLVFGKIRYGSGRSPVDLATALSKSVSARAFQPRGQMENGRLNKTLPPVRDITPLVNNTGIDQHYFQRHDHLTRMMDLFDAKEQDSSTWRKMPPSCRSLIFKTDHFTAITPHLPAKSKQAVDHQFGVMNPPPRTLGHALSLPEQDFEQGRFNQPAGEFYANRIETAGANGQSQHTHVSLSSPIMTAASLINKVASGKLGGSAPLKNLPVNYFEVGITRRCNAEQASKASTVFAFGSNFSGKDASVPPEKCKAILDRMFPEQPLARGARPVLEQKSEEPACNRAEAEKVLIDLRVLFSAHRSEETIYTEHTTAMRQAAAERGITYLGIHGEGHSHKARVNPRSWFGTWQLTPQPQIEALKNKLIEHEDKIPDDYLPIFNKWQELAGELGHERHVIPFATYTKILTDVIRQETDGAVDIKFALGCKSAKDRTTSVLQGMMLLEPIIQHRLTTPDPDGGGPRDPLSGLFDRNGFFTASNLSPFERRLLDENFDLELLQGANDRNVGVPTNINACLLKDSTFKNVPLVHQSNPYTAKAGS